MKKEEIYVLIDSEQKRLRALEILEKAGEIVFINSFLKEEVNRYYRNLEFHETNQYWGMTSGVSDKTEITLEELEKLLSPYKVKKVHITFDELKQQAEKLGFELVKKKREFKGGDFGLFYDFPQGLFFGYLSQIEKENFVDSYGRVCENFRHLTEEEKGTIQNNW